MEDNSDTQKNQEEKPVRRVIHVPQSMAGFIDFIRTQGVVGFAVGFIVGGAVSKLIGSLVNDIINPIVGLIFGREGLQSVVFQLGSAELKVGNFISSAIDFLILALVVYYSVKVIGFERLDKPKP